MPTDAADRPHLTAASLMADQSALVFAGLLFGGYDMGEAAPAAAVEPAAPEEMCDGTGVETLFAASSDHAPALLLATA